MKIADMFGPNKSGALINFYCAQRGVIMPDSLMQKAQNLLGSSADFFLCIDGNGAEIMQMRERSVLLANIVRGRIKRGTVIFFHGGVYCVVNRENWEKICKMITPKVSVEKDERIIAPSRKRTMFDDAMPDRPHKKMQKRGFSHMEQSARNMYLLG